jgi:hypothetical protein
MASTSQWRHPDIFGKIYVTLSQNKLNFFIFGPGCAFYVSLFDLSPNVNGTGQ